MRPQTHVVFLLPLRLFAGWVFLMEALGKLTSGWVQNGKLAAVASGWLHEGKPYSFYTPFLRDVVLPRVHTFSLLVVGGELCVGAALLAGLFSRWAAAGGLLLTLNYMLARGDGVGPNATAPFVAICLTLMLVSTGRALGLDAALRGKIPGWLS
jgi:thiosulfate dehydrogenase [quinone] large subunit